jgi:hypothetical protein
MGTTVANPTPEPIPPATTTKTDNTQGIARRLAIDQFLAVSLHAHPRDLVPMSGNLTTFGTWPWS